MEGNGTHFFEAPDTEGNFKSEEEKIKTRLMTDAKTVFNNINRSERILLKSFFGYTSVIGYREAKKTISNASNYTKTMLWPEYNDEGEELNETLESADFDLEKYVNELSSDYEIKTILYHDMETMKHLFNQAVEFSSNQETAYLKTLQVKYKKKINVCSS